MTPTPNSDVLLLKQSMEFLTAAVKQQTETANINYGKIDGKIDSQAAIINNIQRVVDLMEHNGKLTQKQNEDRFALNDKRFDEHVVDHTDVKKKVQEHHDLMVEVNPRLLASKVGKLERLFWIGFGVTLAWVAIWNSKEWIIGKLGG